MIHWMIYWKQIRMEKSAFLGSIVVNAEKSKGFLLEIFDLDLEGDFESDFETLKHPHLKNSWKILLSKVTFGKCSHSFAQVKFSHLSAWAPWMAFT